MIDLAIPAFPFPRRIKPPLIALIIIQIEIYLGLFFTMTDTLARLVTATSMLVMEAVCVDDKFEMSITDLRFWWPILYIEKVTIRMILSPTS